MVLQDDHYSSYREAVKTQVLAAVNLPGCTIWGICFVIFSNHIEGLVCFLIPWYLRYFFVAQRFMKPGNTC